LIINGLANVKLALISDVNFFGIFYLISRLL